MLSILIYTYMLVPVVSVPLVGTMVICPGSPNLHLDLRTKILSSLIMKSYNPTQHHSSREKCWKTSLARWILSPFDKLISNMTQFTNLWFIARLILNNDGVSEMSHCCTQMNIARNRMQRLGCTIVVLKQMYMDQFKQW